jgi:release factor glutamine methyltransferase
LASNPIFTAGLRGRWRPICGIFAPPLRANRPSYWLGAGCANLLANFLAIIPLSDETSGFSVITPGQCLQRDAPRLCEALQLNVAEARLEVRVLLGHALGVERAWLVAHEHDELPSGPLASYESLLARRLAGEPVAYILGEKEFFGRSFKVTPAALIPRPETELLVELVLDMLAPDRQARILDLGTGSGCIAITLALERPDCEVVATDQSTPALNVARENAVRHGAKVRFCQGNWYQALSAETDKFDLIVSNPPYIAQGDAHLAALTHEPSHALASGADGLDDIRLVVKGAVTHLVPGGWLMFEHGWDHAEACRELLQQARFSQVQTRTDLAGHGRVSLGCLKT